MAKAVSLEMNLEVGCRLDQRDEPLKKHSYPNTRVKTDQGLCSGDWKLRDGSQQHSEK